MLDRKNIRKNGNQIRVIREILWDIQQKRLIYKQFAAILRKYGIRYKQTIPEGMYFLHRGKKFNISPVMKAQDFLDTYREDLGERNLNLDKIELTFNREIPKRKPK